MQKHYNSHILPLTVVVLYQTFDMPVSLELLMAQIFFLPGPRDNALSGRLSLVRSGVTRGHHVLNVINHRVAGRWHDSENQTEPRSAKQYWRQPLLYLRFELTQVSHNSENDFWQMLIIHLPISKYFKIFAFFILFCIDNADYCCDV